MAFTYNDLVTQLEATLDRDDDEFTDQIPNFVQQAQIMIARDSKFLGFLVSLTSNFTMGNLGRVQKPTGWRQTVSFNYGSGATNDTRTPLKLRTYEYCIGYWPDPSVTDSTNPPLYYCEWQSDWWQVAPTPDQAYPFEVLAYMTPTQLTASNTTNWLTDYAPDILLYASLLQAAPFLKNDTRLKTWQVMYGQAVQSQKVEYDRQVVDRQQLIEAA